MNRIIPPKLCAGDEIRIIAPSGRMGILGQETMDLANERFAMLGLQLSFGRHVLECDALQSSSISSRLEDLHQAFSDPLVKGIFTVIGGFNVNQLLEHIDYESIKKNPKI